MGGNEQVRKLLTEQAERENEILSETTINFFGIYANQICEACDYETIGRIFNNICYRMDSGIDNAKPSEHKEAYHNWLEDTYFDQVKKSEKKWKDGRLKKLRADYRKKIKAATEPPP